MVLISRSVDLGIQSILVVAVIIHQRPKRGVIDGITSDGVCSGKPTEYFNTVQATLRVVVRVFIQIPRIENAPGWNETNRQEFKDKLDSFRLTQSRTHIVNYHVVALPVRGSMSCNPLLIIPNTIPSMRVCTRARSASVSATSYITG